MSAIEKTRSEPATVTTGAFQILVTSPIKGMTVTMVEVHINTAPTSAGTIDGWTDSALGTAYDTIHRSTNPVTPATVDVEWQGPIYVPAGDVFTLDYANPDNRTVGGRVHWAEGRVS